MNEEQQRLDANASKNVPLELWGPYLSERQWGTVREDYSEDGDAWNYFPHDHARSRAYRWGEDGIAGISDYNQHLCFALAFWNGKDPILKERLFGLTNGEGNHGEDVKELYYYLDNLPSHYYMQYLYKYPQQAFPYETLKEKNAAAGKQEPEFEILDTAVFNESQYFDIYISYAKQSSDDIYIKIEAINRYHETATLQLLPTLWFFNNWHYTSNGSKPSIERAGNNCLLATHPTLGDYYLYFQHVDDTWLTENENNLQRLTNQPNDSTLVKDAFHDAVIHNANLEALTQKTTGTKACVRYRKEIDAGASASIYLRLTREKTTHSFDEGFEKLFDKRKQEADDFYETVIDKELPAAIKNIQRQAYAGLLWSKQFYHYDVERWISTSDGFTPVTQQRLNGRNSNWQYLKNQDVMLMPDKWEYPWYAAWDLAFHCIAIAPIDPVFAKNQLIILTREWYMNPEGQIPAYEWNFSDVNPPVHAFAALKVYRIEQEKKGTGDIKFLKKIFHKLIINFTWWINRRDINGNNIFEGGFLGLDNIGVFNRSIQLPGEMFLEQTDGTSWMGMYAMNMAEIAFEIAMTDDAFEDTVTKFYEHFVLIAEALNELGLWDANDAFYYDVLRLSEADPIPLKLRSVVGLSPLFAVLVVDKKLLDHLPDFKKRMRWFIDYRLANHKYIAHRQSYDESRMLLSLTNEEKLKRLVSTIMEEDEFLSVAGVRALSKHYEKHPYTVSIEGNYYEVSYNPGDSTSGLFGGNSNWRGPVWMPVNYMVIEALKKYGDFYKDELQCEFPKGSGNHINLTQAAGVIKERLLSIFKRNEQDERPLYGQYNWFYQLPGNRDLILFHEYFHGETGRGLGASHQTGWTALIATL